MTHSPPAVVLSYLAPALLPASYRPIVTSATTPWYSKNSMPAPQHGRSLAALIYVPNFYFGTSLASACNHPCVCMCRSSALFEGSMSGDFFRMRTCLQVYLASRRIYGRGAGCGKTRANRDVGCGLEGGRFHFEATRGTRGRAVSFRGIPDGNSRGRNGECVVFESGVYLGIVAGNCAREEDHQDHHRAEERILTLDVVPRPGKQSPRSMAFSTSPFTVLYVFHLRRRFPRWLRDPEERPSY